MLYITNGLDGEQFEDYMNCAMYEYSDEVVYAALDLRGEWVSDSNNPTSLAMEKEVAELLKLPHRHYSSTTGPMADLTEDQKKAIVAIYDVTQRLLHGKGISHVVVYRGFGWSERPEWVNEGLEEGQIIRIDEQRTLSSWSFSQKDLSVIIILGLL
ncbi:hypothetical protein [Brevibacillus sp. H7]|uniref:hypothetical protein n=1 Tax=Brevibacillus sp. H7 TaxID=3349138 RepID=UPI0037F4FC1A